MSLFEGVADKLLLVFSSIMNWMYESFIQPFKDLPTLKKLVFGTHKEEQLVWGTFEPSNLKDGFEPMYNMMMILAGFALVILIVTYAMRISGAPLNPSRRNEGISFIKDLILVGVLLMNLPIFYDLLFTVNSAIVNMFSGALSSNLDELKNEPLDPDNASSGLLGWIFTQLVLIGLTIWASFYYLMRKITLIILMGMGPLMIVFWLQPQLKPMTSAWLRELIGSIFVQAIHAFVFWTVAVVSMTATGFVETVIVYVIFIPIAESIRRLLNFGGDMQGGFSKAGAMMGMAGLAGMYGAAKGAFDGKSVMSTVKGAYEGTKGVKGGKDGDNAGVDDGLKSTLGAGAGGDTGTTPRAEKMLRAGDIMGKMGKATFGMAGSVAGMGLGPVGSMAGSSAGFAIGGVAGGLAGRTGAAAAQGIASRFGKGLEDAKAFREGKNGEEFDTAFADEVADRETAAWADSNKEKQMNELRERFPDASVSDIEKKFDNIKADKRAGFHAAAVEQLRSARESEGVSGDNLSQSVADRDIANWESENKPTQMESLKASYPNASPEELEEKYQAIKQGKRAGFYNDAKQQLQTARNGGSESIESYANEQADHQMANWEADNKESQMQGLRSQYPSATEDELQEKYQTIKAGKRQGFYNDAKSQISSTQGMAKGVEIVETAGQAMANQWATDNKAAFFADYDHSNPIQPDETEGEYATRRQAAFNKKVSAVKDSFLGAGKQYVTDNTTAENGFVSKDAFMEHMGQTAKSVGSVGEVGNIVQSGNTALQHTHGSNVFDENGRPNAEALSGRMAQVRTAEMKKAYVQQQVAQGVSESDATQDWQDNHQTQAYGQNLKTYQDGFKTSGGNISQLSGASTSPADIMAQARTSEMKKAYVQQQVALGVSEGDATQEWKNNHQAQTYDQNLKTYQGSLGAVGATLASTSEASGSASTASVMAQARTSEMKKDFVQQQVAQGVSESDATFDWQNNHQGQAYSQNLKTYQDSLDAANVRSDSTGLQGSKVGTAIQSIAVGAASATGITGGAKVLKSGYQSVMDGGRVAIAEANTLTEQGSNPVQTVYGAAKSGWKHAGEQFLQLKIDEAGGAVQAHANHQNKSGYAAGVVFGTAGYQQAKKLANKLSPYAQQVQAAIHSPSEVMQMAQTTTDNHGNVKIASGAIRQVTSAQGSHIEVTTKSGETQIVSRQGSGHSGMKKGDVVYQDLTMDEENNLIPSSPSTYRMDSGGGRVSSSIQMQSNPNTLLNTTASASASSNVRKNAPVFSQAVDSGNFYTQDLAAQGFENVQVVIEKDRQFVTGEKDGTTYRVSQVFAGDTRLDNGQSVNVPVQVTESGIKPTMSEGSAVAVQSNIIVDGVEVDEAVPYYSTKSTRGLLENVDELVTSKHHDRAYKSLDKREQLESIRRKQGLLG